jgi:hypothetical protein
LLRTGVFAAKMERFAVEEAVSIELLAYCNF